jgi:diguanylate cyclase (GGDEF)-like protein/PAS domain S-box-containing protein
VNADATLAEAGGVSQPEPSILVVNDSEGQRIAMRAMLGPLGVVVVEADSGAAALHAVLRQTFALILMDVRMPMIDGFETARLIRQRRQSSRTPIIFVTAFGQEDTETLAAYTSGAVDFIFAPVIPEVVRAKVSVFVELFVQAQQLQRSLDSITMLNTALRDSEASTQAVLDSVADGIVTAGTGGLIESFNPAARGLFGYHDDDAIGHPLSLIIAPDRREEFQALADVPDGRLTNAGGVDRLIETLGRRKDGSTFAMEVERGEIKRGDQILTLAFVRDISERKAYTESLEHQALHDPLTGLANRTLFGEHLLQALASAKRGDEPRALLVMDLDGFKQVNDTLGHDRGDLLLKQVAERLVATLRDTDMVARLGGDEFGILPGGATDLAAAAEVAWKIQQIGKREFVVHEDIVHVAASIGIALIPDHGTTAAKLLQRADAAMYVAKRSGGGHAVFDAAKEAEAARQLERLTDLRQCVPREELVIHYLPKIDLAAREVSGVEALVRWQHPVHGLLTPDRFLPAVERTELIEPLTRWVLNAALRQQRLWRDDGVDLTMAVNISAHSLRFNSNLPEMVAALTETWGTAPGRLTLELTEGALIEAAAPDILGRLHRMGEKMSIDDFGTGYSSLAHLQRLPVDELKIDRSFVTSLALASDEEVIVRSTIDLAHNLGLSVVAEGVEDEDVLRLLAEHDCDAAQGYFFSRPCVADELTAWLTASPDKVPVATH